MRTIGNLFNYKLTDEELCILTLQLGVPTTIIRMTVEYLSDLTSPKMGVRDMARRRLGDRLAESRLNIYVRYYVENGTQTYGEVAYVDTMLYNAADRCSRVLLISELIRHMEQLYA